MLPVYSRLSTHHLLSGSLLPKSKTTPESCRVAEERGPERARTSLRPHGVSSGARTAANGSQLRAGAVSLSLHCSRCVLGTPGDKLERAGLGRNTERRLEAFSPSTSALSTPGTLALGPGARWV